MKLIDKSAVVAEIDKLKGKVSDCSSYCNGWQHALRMLELSLDTLEVKEVDLLREFDIEDAVHGTVDYPFIGHDFPIIYPNYKELKEYCERKGIKDNDKVKLIIIKDM